MSRVGRYTPVWFKSTDRNKCVLVSSDESQLQGLVWQKASDPDQIAGVAQLVEHNLAKVGVASSNLVSRSMPE